ncbi:carboxypeptidase-like regulatory domain-containing protein [Hymenobacter sp. BT186]|uniref:Carboxypeptidase-like regulatory domain-containing protein n=2 Tax=Hymenobacter telluris TaxID=2816474 RepID=A0A939EWK1_9BACT|nr:carboxypeptidase-like regulatory domain-containing protein [Hymenobacter telluris]MBW3374543.1 carboxypeptidase-like regulatory domain-containing protein [Hymenobacter norwichensis]
MPHFSAAMGRLLRPVRWCLWRAMPLTPLALPVLLLPAPTAVAQQNTITISGTVRDAAGQPVELVGVGVEGQAGGTATDSQGRFTLRVPRTGRSAVLVVRGLRFKPLRVPLTLNQDQPELRLTLQGDTRALSNVTVRARTDEANTSEQVSMIKLDPRTAKVLPSPFGDFNAILKTLPGVSSTNELTSTYSVRGGNYDENLVYVNGIEIYRPFLVTAAQQEGLSFINPDLVNKVEFSTGGWQPQFGDKLSSVLNVQYKQPTKFAASGTASLVGGAAHAEATSPNKRLSYLAGIRYKNATYVLRSLKQQQGGYNPTFYDGQAYINANLGPQDNPERTSLGLLTTFSHNDYRFTPETGQSTFSTATNQFTRLFIAYQGRERMQYDMYQGGLNLKHNFSSKFQTELLGGLVYSRELEYRDVEAAYSLADINRDPSQPDFNLPVRQRDVGSRFDHSRNTLTARIATVEARARWTPSARNVVRFGVKSGRERIEDTLNEYSFADSADYVPDGRRTRQVSDLDLSSTRTQGYAQHTIELDSARTLTYGVRAHYWSTNQQVVVSPRVQYSFVPRKHPNHSYKVATGLYYQPPFYRELRDQQGTRATPGSPLLIQASLNPELRAQRSLHLIVGNEIRFEQWGRPFRFTGEAYLKYLTDVVPYDIDNVRLRYFAKNNANAYVAGFDARLGGEFVNGAESWFSLGVLTTRENIDGDSITRYNADGAMVGRDAKGYIRRPQDQRVNLGIFFQDHLPDNPSVRGYVNLVFGTGLPFSPPGLPELRGTSALTRSYKRADLGFSKVIALNNQPDRPAGKLESLWIGLEILNVLGANNVGGYSYIQDLNGRTYSVPNYLSQRVVNLRVIGRF